MWLGENRDRCPSFEARPKAAKDWSNAQFAGASAVDDA